MQVAPFFDDIADGPAGGRAVWTEADDGRRIRLGLWPLGDAKGTVLLLPGRTEYVEKYGRTARALTAGGLAVLAIDWRGQGLSDRLTDDPTIGHVCHFTDYQRDMQAMLRAAERLDLPRPWHLLAHSMGGAIGLRAAMDGAPVRSCAFSAPMWGIRIRPVLRPVAWSLSWGVHRMGMGHLYAPGTSKGSYILTEPFATNKLTTDREMYEFMVGQCRAHPELALGGPSYRWLNEALRECRALAQRPSPALPCLTILGSEEDIVEPARIHRRMADWADGDLLIIEGARHEVLMETPEIRDRIHRRLCDFYTAEREPPRPDTTAGPAVPMAGAARPAP